MTRDEALLLHRALQLCDGWNGRLQIETMGGVKGPVKSRYNGPVTDWTCAVDGITFRLFPAGLAPGGNGFHRLYVRCPICGREVSAGRFHQHANIHVPPAKSTGTYRRTSLWHRNWYVDDLGHFKPIPYEWQREFPSKPAGF